MVSESSQSFSPKANHSQCLGLAQVSLGQGHPGQGHFKQGHSESEHSKDWIDDRYEIQQPLPIQPNSLKAKTTFLAWDHQAQIPVVLKTLPVAALQSWKCLDLFEREALALSQLHHPAIPRYLDYIEAHPCDRAAPTTFYLVQAYVEGPSLAECVLRGDRFSETTVKAIARQGLELLSYLHQLNPPLIHRDIKPDNLICSTSSNVTDNPPRIHLVDFGAAQAITSSGSTIMGTYGYMAPEQFLGQASTASDLYSLGATLLHLLSHQNPGTLPSHRLRIDFRKVVNLSADFAQWLDCLLAPIAADRFNSAALALSALDNPALVKPILEHINLDHPALVNPTLNIDPLAGSQPGIATHPSANNPSNRRESNLQPSHSKIRLHRHSGQYPLGQPSLTLDIPPIGLQRELWALGGFALLWNGGLLYWLIMAWTMDAPWFYPLASAPLWGLGIWLMAHLGQSLFGQVRLMVENDQYCLERKLGPFRQSQQGPLSDWHDISLRPQYHQASRQASRQPNSQPSIQSNSQASSGTPPPSNSQASEAGETLAMVLDLETVEFGSTLSTEEKTWLVHELQDFLSTECSHHSSQTDISHHLPHS